MRRGAAAFVLALVAAVGLPACAQPGDGGYRLTADFSRAVALYPRSRVKVMGVDVGTVTSIELTVPTSTPMTFTRDRGYRATAREKSAVRR